MWYIAGLLDKFLIVNGLISYLQTAISFKSIMFYLIEHLASVTTPEHLNGYSIPSITFNNNFSSSFLVVAALF